MPRRTLCIASTPLEEHPRSRSRSPRRACMICLRIRIPPIRRRPPQGQSWAHHLRCQNRHPFPFPFPFPFPLRRPKSCSTRRTRCYPNLSCCRLRRRCPFPCLFRSPYRCCSRRRSLSLPEWFLRSSSWTHRRKWQGRCRSHRSCRSRRVPRRRPRPRLPTKRKSSKARPPSTSHLNTQGAPRALRPITRPERTTPGGGASDAMRLRWGRFSSFRGLQGRPGSAQP
jgi:hypothetical protein